MLRRPKYKQAMVVRRDLGMGRGKIAVQCCHASVSAAEEARIRNPEWWSSWIRDGQPKIVLKVGGLEILLRLEVEAKGRGIPFCLVRDKGLTQVPAGAVTCLGIGPAPLTTVDILTGDLPLL